MHKIISLAVFFLFAVSCYSQNVAGKYAEIIDSAKLYKHLSVIASAEMEGRETGTEGEKRAAAYIVNHFEKVGLKTIKNHNNYRQYYPLVKDSLITNSIWVGNEKAVYGEDFYFPLKTNKTQNSISTGIVFAGYGIKDSIYNDYKNLNVKGKTVIFFTGEPKSDSVYLLTGNNNPGKWSGAGGLQNKLAVAREHGAKNALIISATIENVNKSIITYNTLSPLYYPYKEEAVSLSHAMVSHAFAIKILGSDKYLKTAETKSFFTEQFSINKKVKFSFKKNSNTILSANVIGYIEGSDKKNEYVFITAHYDHLGYKNGKLYYGADDDGSGTVAVMMMAEAFAKAKAQGDGPRRSIVFMTVSGEEKGLWGSYYYSENPLIPLIKTSADLNIDMIGRIDTERKLPDTLNYVYVVGHNKLSSELPGLLKNALSENFSMSLDYKFDDPNDPNRIYYRSDHYNFARKGVPVLFFYDGMLKADYHKPSDTVDKINWALYEKRARFIFYVAWDLANRENMLLRDLPLN